MRITREDVLDYHRGDRPGKLQIQATKPLLTQRDLSLAYSPGVAHAVLALDEDPLLAYEYTTKGNLIAVVTNGTAILGLGNRGAIPAKPVMEGKALLFKRLADVDVFDIELDAATADEIVAAVKAIAPGFGGINLEDIAAPICFEVEERLRKMLDIPVFHDDQHGTAIITSAALLNALELTDKDIHRVKVVVNGAGAAGVACAQMYVSLGVRRENITMFDRVGSIYLGRTEEMDSYKGFFAQSRPMTLEEALRDADVFLGVSVADVLTPEMLKAMAPNPILFTLANPDPEIDYRLAVTTRPDAIVATGRSDYPNQVNNVLGFPYVFRGALDVRASAINEEMKMAAAQALAALAKEYVPESVLTAYELHNLRYGREYIIPKPNDHRALEWVASAVAEAAMRTGVARKEIDPAAYRLQLEGSQRRGWRVMARIVEKAQQNPKRIVFVEGEHPKVLRAVQQIENSDVAVPILLGNPEVIGSRIVDLGLSCSPEVVQIDISPRLEAFALEIYQLRRRKGVTLEQAREMVRTPNVFGLMMVKMGEADAFLSGLTHDYPSIIRPALQLIRTRPGVSTVAGVYLVITRSRAYFLADGLVNIAPDASSLAEIAILTADFAAELDIEPRIAMLSFSNFGSVNHPETLKMRHAVQIVRDRRPDLRVDGEMQADVALSGQIMDEQFPFSAVRDANVLIFPSLDAANSSYKLLSQLGAADVVGPVMVGMNKSVHPLQPSADQREILRMTALAVVAAQASH
jgi:malate dehydrogenase (oxaloacetate-decarboxylating)(NADP+)